MKSITFIMGLRDVYEAFQEEVEFAKRTPMPEYYRFLKALGFYAYIEQVITACVMYPRCIQTCRDNLQDLSFGIYNNLGIGSFHLVQFDQDRMRWQIEAAGREIMKILEGHRYYCELHEIPRQMRDDAHYSTDLTAVPDVRKINDFTFIVTIDVHHFNDNFELPQNAIELPRSNSRSY